VSSSTLRSWANQGKIDSVRIGAGKRLYNNHQIKDLFGVDLSHGVIQKKKIIYARVSSDHQKGDLERQIKMLQEYYPNYILISDIASGLNFKRKGLTSILEQVDNDCVECVVVADRDRLCRFGFELIEWQKSWFTTIWRQQTKENSKKTSYPSSQYLWQEIIARDQQEIEEKEREKPKKRRKLNRNKLGKKNHPHAEKTKKIRIYPNEQQRQILKKWFGAYRWTYNACLVAVRDAGVPLSFEPLRHYCVNTETIKFPAEQLFAAHYLINPDWKNIDWLLEVPYDVRDEAMKALIQSYDTEFGKRKEYSSHHFEIKMKTKKLKRESIKICSKHTFNHKKGVKHIQDAYQWLFNNLESEKPLPDLDHDFNITKDQYGDYWICIPKPLEKWSENQAPKSRCFFDGIVALDPGVVSFQTTYSPEGVVTEWGKKDMGKITRLCVYLDDLHSRYSTKILDCKKSRKLHPSKRFPVCNTDKKNRINGYKGKKNKKELIHRSRRNMKKAAARMRKKN